MTQIAIAARPDGHHLHVIIFIGPAEQREALLRLAERYCGRNGNVAQVDWSWAYGQARHNPDRLIGMPDGGPRAAWLGLGDDRVSTSEEHTLRRIAACAKATARRMPAQVRVWLAPENTDTSAVQLRWSATPDAIDEWAEDHGFGVGSGLAVFAAPEDVAVEVPGAVAATVETVTAGWVERLRSRMPAPA